MREGVLDQTTRLATGASVPRRPTRRRARVDEPSAASTSPPCALAAVRALEDELGVSVALAQVLVRRGLGDPAAARAFLAADERHDPAAFAGIDDAAGDRPRARRGAARAITVHGDYDVDGVCSTAILVRALRALGADVDWYLPSRTDDGYGLAAATVERLAAARHGAADHRRLRDHRRRRGRAARARSGSTSSSPTTTRRAPTGALPDAPIVHPAVGGYPCPDLCAAGVAYKLAAALLAGAGRDPAQADARPRPRGARHRGRLRAAARREPPARARGAARAARRRASPGLRALHARRRRRPRRGSTRARSASGSRRASTPPAACTAPTPALELAAHRRSRARRGDRRRARRGQRRAPPRRDAHPLRGRGAASPRPASRRPTCWPARTGTRASSASSPRGSPSAITGRASWSRSTASRGPARGARSPPSTCSAASTRARRISPRHGGHRAAAGLHGRAREQLDAFRAAFAGARAGRARAGGPRAAASASTRSSPATSSGSALAEELEALAPFGIGNPRPTLLVPAARLADPRPMGEGRHVRFTARGGRPPRAGGRVRDVAGSPTGEALDAAVRARAQRVERGGRAAARAALRPAARAAGGRSLAGEPEDPVAARAGGARRPPLPGAPRRDAARGRARRATAAAAAWRASSRRSSPRASRCSSSCADARAPAPASRRAARRLRARLVDGAGARPRRSPTARAHVVALDPPRRRRPGCAASTGASCSPGARPRSPSRCAALEHGLRAARPGGAARVRGAARRRRLDGAARGRARPAHGRPASLRVLAELGLVTVDRDDRDGSRRRHRADGARALGGVPRVGRAARRGPVAARGRAHGGDGRVAGGGGRPGLGYPWTMASEADTRTGPRATGGRSRPPVTAERAPVGERRAHRRARAGRPRRSHRDRAPAARRPVRDRRGARRRRGGRDRPRARRGRLPLRLRAPRRPAAQVGRGLHHPPGRRGEDLRGHAPRHRDAVRRAAARHRRGHERVARRGPRALRRRGRDARRRRHEAHRHHLHEPRRGAGRELPQDDGRDGHGHPGHPHQARRSPAQHAHDRRAAQAEADRQGQGDPGDLRADRAPARHPRDQVGARGPRLRRAAPAQVPGDQGPGQPAARRSARTTSHDARRRARRASSTRSASTRRSPGARSTSTRSTRR